MRRVQDLSPRERLVFHVQELERLEELRNQRAEDVKDAFDRAKGEGYDTGTLRVVLKLRKMSPHQRQERRALEAIYLAALGMLEGDALPEEARRRLDEPTSPSKRDQPDDHGEQQPFLDGSTQEQPRPAEQPTLALKDPDEARQEGAAAALEGKRIYDNPYPAGDPCRAAWDEGWCGQKKSHGMDTPAAYQRRTEKKPEKKDDDEQGADEKRGAA